MFTLENKYQIPASGVSVSGLAYRPETNSFFTINRNGYNPFNVQEMAIVDGKVQILKVWGPLNDANDRLKMANQALVSMKGLCYDPDLKVFWFNYSSYYNANAANLPVLGAFSVEDGVLKSYGPWYTSSSETTKGNICLHEGKLICIGVKGSTPQSQSWGLGVVSVDKPALDTPPYTMLNSVRLVHWPMKTYEGVAQSDFPLPPGSPKAVYITGNSLVNGITLSYEYNKFSNIRGGGTVQSGLIINGEIYYFGIVHEGYQWYGFKNSHCDSSPSGEFYNNNLDSLIGPGKCVSYSNPKGVHAEAIKTYAYRVPLNGLRLDSSFDEAVLFDNTDTLGQGVYANGRLYILEYGPFLRVYNIDMIPGERFQAFYRDNALNINGHILNCSYDRALNVCDKLQKLASLDDIDYICKVLSDVRI